MNRKQIVLAVAVLFATACVAFLLGTKVRGQLESPPPPAASPTALPSNPLDDAPPCVKVLASDEKYDKPCVVGGHTGKWECARNRIDVWCNTTAGSIPRSTEHCIVNGRGEACNHLDDNCDGRIDEGFDLWGDDRNCGNCGNVCEGGQMCYQGKCEVEHAPSW